MQAGSKINTLLYPYLILFFFSVIPHHELISKSIVYFSPDDKPQKHLIGYINGAKTRIYAAIYMFTDKKIAQALMDAKDRGIDVQIITDQTSVDSVYGKIFLLQEYGVKIFVFNLNKRKGKFSWYDPIMHNKFAIIDEHVWTGSFNWTVSANSKNQENVIYTDEKNVCEKYLEHFNTLKERCVIDPVRNQPAEEKSVASNEERFPEDRFKLKTHVPQTRVPRFRNRRSRR